MKQSFNIGSAIFLALTLLALAACGGGSGGNRAVDDGGTTTNPNMLYVAGSSSVTAYTIGSNGTLTQKSTTTGGDDPQVALVSPDGKTLAVTNLNGVTVSSFRIDRTTGALTAAPGSPFASGAGGGYPRSLAFAPNSAYLYLGRTIYADRLDVYSVNASTSALSLVGAPAVPGYTATEGVAVHPDGNHVYFYGNGVAVYQNNGGILVPVAGSPLLTSNQFVSVAVHPSGNYLAAADPTGVHVYALNNGVPGNELSGSPILYSPSTFMTELLFNGDGSRAFALLRSTNLGGAGALVAFSITVTNGTATVAQTGSAITTTSPSSLTLDSTGKFAYVIDTNAGQLSGFSIGSNGSLTPIGSPMASTGIAIAAGR